MIRKSINYFHFNEIEKLITNALDIRFFFWLVMCMARTTTILLCRHQGAAPWVHLQKGKAEGRPSVHVISALLWISPIIITLFKDNLGAAVYTTYTSFTHSYNITDLRISILNFWVSKILIFD